MIASKYERGIRRNFARWKRIERLKANLTDRGEKRRRKEYRVDIFFCQPYRRCGRIRWSEQTALLKLRFDAVNTTARLSALRAFSSHRTRPAYRRIRLPSSVKVGKKFYRIATRLRISSPRISPVAALRGPICAQAFANFPSRAPTPGPQPRPKYAPRIPTRANSNIAVLASDEKLPIRLDACANTNVR